MPSSGCFASRSSCRFHSGWRSSPWQFVSCEGAFMTASVLVLCAAGMLVTAFLMVGQKALFTTIRLYGLQSGLLAIVAVTNAIADGRHDLFVTAALTLTLKGWLIPRFLMRVIDR